jgi:hypothetical protein
VNEVCRIFAALVAASVLSLGPCCFGDENIQEIALCEEIDHNDSSEFKPVDEAAKTFVISNVGAHGGRTISNLARSLAANGFFVRQAGVVAGRLLVWVLAVDNPLVVAVGYVVMPSTSAKCDVLYSDDVECLLRNPCIKPLSFIEPH